MQDYNNYVKCINKIYECLATMKAKWNDQDNCNYIESIDEYKEMVIRNAEIFKKEAPKTSPNNANMEALGK